MTVIICSSAFIATARVDFVDFSTMAGQWLQDN